MTDQTGDVLDCSSSNVTPPSDGVPGPAPVERPLQYTSPMSPYARHPSPISILAVLFLGCDQPTSDGASRGSLREAEPDSTTSEDVVYEHYRERNIDGEVTFFDSYGELSLADRFRVSRMPADEPVLYSEEVHIQIREDGSREDSYIVRIEHNASQNTIANVAPSWSEQPVITSWLSTELSEISPADNIRVSIKLGSFDGWSEIPPPSSRRPSRSTNMIKPSGSARVPSPPGETHSM